MDYVKEENPVAIEQFNLCGKYSLKLLSDCLNGLVVP